MECTSRRSQSDLEKLSRAKGIDFRLAIYFRQPYVLDRESGMREAGAFLAGFGVSDA